MEPWLRRALHVHPGIYSIEHQRVSMKAGARYKTSLVYLPDVYRGRLLTGFLKNSRATSW